MLEHFLTPLEAAERLSISPRTIQTWLWKGKLKGIKAGKLWRIREKDLEIFLDFSEVASCRDNEPTLEEIKKANARLERHIVSLGHPTGTDNEAIDADLVHEYGRHQKF